MEIRIIKNPISKNDLRDIARNMSWAYVKGVVDLKRSFLAVGGELHADEESALLEDGSEQDDLWGINLYPDEAEDEWIEFDSMINIRPSRGNRTRGVEDSEIRKQIISLIGRLII